MTCYPEAMWDAAPDQDHPPGQPDEQARTLTKTGVKARGWTDKMIRELLGEPDERRPNPRYSGRADYLLYLLERVEEAERTDAFFELLDQSERRKDRGAVAGVKTAEQRLAKIQAQIEAFDIVLPDLTPDELVLQSCASYNAWAVSNGLERKPITPKSDSQALTMVRVSFLLHATPGYRELFAKLWKQPGAAEARRRLNERIYQVIATTYPEFTVECERQNKRKLFPTPKQQAQRERMSVARRDAKREKRR